MKAQKYTGLILPEHQPSAKNSLYRAIGYVLRGAVALLCTFAMSRFVFDCMGAELAHGYVFGICLALTALFSLMAVNRTLFASGTVLTVCGTVFVLQSIGDIVDVCYLAAMSVFNTWCTRLVSVGYRAMKGSIVDVSAKLSDMGRTEVQMLRLAAFFMMLFFAAICVFAIIRRAKATLLFGAYAAVVTVALYFEIVEDPTGLFFMLAAVFAAVTLSVYDSVFCKRKSVSAALGTVNGSQVSKRELEYTLKANSCLGGYAGALSALAALIVIFSITGISTPMKDIPQISHPAEKVQIFLTSALEDRESSLMAADSAVQKSRKTTAVERTSSGSRVFTVHADVDIPIYLRSWTGKYYYNDGWYTASSDMLEAYRETFGTGFSHEFLTSELILAIDPTLYDLADPSEQISAQLGFVSSYVHISKKTPTGSLVFMPSYTDQRARLLKYGTDDKLTLGSYQNYYDGIFVSSSYIFTDDYTVLARLGLSPTQEIAQNIAKFVQYYAGEYEVLRSMRALLLAGKDISEVREAYPSLTADTTPISTVSGGYTFPTGEDRLSYRYAFVMDEDERLHIDALTDNLSLYQDYVYDNYLSVHEHFNTFNSLVRQICQDNGIDVRRDASAYDGRHRIVSAVIDYLSENMTYTLSPKSPNSAYLNAAATFLFDTKEGYCSQYASAAIMLLRSAGIPARYAEGYVADEFTKDTSRSAPGKYVSHVTDSKAHAWVEVYYDYYGWVTYEVTLSYSEGDEPADTDVGTDTTTNEDTTAPPVQTVGTDAPTSTDNVVTTADTTPSSDTTEPPSQGGTDNTGMKTVVWCVIISAGVCAFAVIIVSLKRRTDKIRDEHDTLIRRASEGIDDNAERVAAARKLGDVTMRLLKIKKLSPEKAEAPSAFGARTDVILGETCDVSFHEVMRAISAAEFGDFVSSEELILIASGVAYLEKSIMSEAGPIKRAVYKYFGLMY